MLSELPDEVGSTLAKISVATNLKLIPVISDLKQELRLQAISDPSPPSCSFCPNTCKSESMSQRSDKTISDGLRESFWMSAHYCGYMRCTYAEAGDVSPSDVVLNDAYASLSGMGRDELIAR